MTHEPHGHRGHPTDFEARKARALSKRLERVIDLLVANGFSDDEAVAFIAGTAFERAARSGETWATPVSARATVEKMRLGHAAKEWSLSAIIVALLDIAALFEEGDPR